MSVERQPPDLVSVIVPVRNGAATLPEQLEALSKQTYSGRWELVIADNRSTDTTRAVAESWADRLPDLRVVDASQRPGSSHARNVGAELARGQLLAFCDADDVVDERWLECLVSAAVRYDLVGGVQDEQRLNTGRVLASRAGRGRTKLLRPYGFLAFAPTSNLAMWREPFEAIHGLNVTYPQSHDVELSWRAQLRGYRLGHASDAVVHYRYRSTPRGVAKQAYWTGYDAAQLYRDYRRHGLKAPRWSDVARRWGAMVWRLPTVVMSSQRLVWMRLAANNLGRLRGSLTFRVLFL